MTSKQLSILTLTLILAFTFSASLVMAQDKKAVPPEADQQMVQMSPEDQKAFNAIRQAHRKKMAPLKDQLWAKEMEYDALAANPNTKPAEIKAIIAEMAQLRAQLRAEHDAFMDQAQGKGYDMGQWHGRPCGFYNGNGPGGNGYGPGNDGYGKGRHHGGGNGYGRHHQKHWSY